MPVYFIYASRIDDSDALPDGYNPLLYFQNNKQGARSTQDNSANGYAQWPRYETDKELPIFQICALRSARLPHLFRIIQRQLPSCLIKMQWFTYISSLVFGEVCSLRRWINADNNNNNPKTMPYVPLASRNSRNTHIHNRSLKARINWFKMIN